MHMFVLPVVQAVIYAVGHSPVPLPYVRHIHNAAAGAEVDASIHADVFVGFVDVALAYGKHLT